MRRFPLIVCAAALAAGFSAVAASSAAEPTQTLDVTVCPTAVGSPVSDSVDGAGGEHMRGFPVTTEMYVEGTDCYTGTFVGDLSYEESFNIQPQTGASTAWCNFTMDLGNSGVFQGHCNGDLVEGHLLGHGAGGSTLKGTYENDEPANPFAGRYHLVLQLYAR